MCAKSSLKLTFSPYVGTLNSVLLWLMKNAERKCSLTGSCSLCRYCFMQTLPAISASGHEYLLYYCESSEPEKSVLTRKNFLIVSVPPPWSCPQTTINFFTVPWAMTRDRIELPCYVLEVKEWREEQRSHRTGRKYYIRKSDSAQATQGGRGKRFILRLFLWVPNTGSPGLWGHMFSEFLPLSKLTFMACRLGGMSKKQPCVCVWARCLHPCASAVLCCFDNSTDPRTLSAWVRELGALLDS